MRKIAAVLLAAVMALSLAACAGGKEPAGNGGTEADAAPQTESEKAREAASADSPGNGASTDGADHMTAGAVSPADTAASETEEEQMEEKNLKLTIGSTAVQVDWKENESVNALRELVKDAPLAVRMSMYGGFEQVGSLGTALPRDDVQTRTQAGDIVLYSGDQIVVFYGSNSWAYTRLGHIADQTAEEMTELLGGGDVTITLSME